MEYKVYQLAFRSAVHFGRQNLEDGEYTFCADTLFSALCQEAMQRGADVFDSFYQYVKNGVLLLSDAFPYIGKTYYLPKPMKRIETAQNRGDSKIKKAYKKLKYIPMEQIGIYLAGNYDVIGAQDEGMDRLGYFEMKTAASIRGEEETKPYRIGTYYYHAGNGLYIIVGYQQQEAATLLEELLTSLSFSGIGGKRAAGLGRFELRTGALLDGFCDRLTKEGRQYMSLSISLPREEELESALDKAEYLLCKRSGFVASSQYALEQMRKRDLYAFQAGSCFVNRYQGDIYDVSDKKGRHPVYRYAKPMFMEVDA